MRRLALLGALAVLLLSASPTFAASDNGVWRTKLTAPGISGGATLAVVSNGHRASVAVKIWNVAPTTKLTATLNDGACLSTTVIASRLTFKAPVAGPAVHRFWLTTTELATLKTDIGNKDTLSISVAVTPKGGSTTTVCGNLAPVK